MSEQLRAKWTGELRSIHPDDSLWYITVYRLVTMWVENYVNQVPGYSERDITRQIRSLQARGKRGS